MAMELEFARKPAAAAQDDDWTADVESLDARLHARACAEHVRAFCAYARAVHGLDVRGPRLLLSCNPAAPFTWGLLYVHAPATPADFFTGHFTLFASDLVGVLSPDAHKRIRFRPLLDAVRGWNGGHPAPRTR